MMQHLKVGMEESIKTNILFQGVQPTGSFIRVICQKIASFFSLFIYILKYPVINITGDLDFQSCTYTKF